MAFLFGLLGSQPYSHELQSFLRDVQVKSNSLQTTATSYKDVDAPAADVKHYSDVSYFNYYPLGLSLQFSHPKRADNQEDLVNKIGDALCLDSIDLYNSSIRSPPFEPFPMMPFHLEGLGDDRSIQVNSITTAKDFVIALGEPTRKGGGTGPSSGSINIWC